MASAGHRDRDDIPATTTIETDARAHHPTATSTPGPLPMSLHGYKIHPSALASAAASATAPALSTTAVATTQHAATLAATDSLRTASHPSASNDPPTAELSPGSSLIRDVVQRLMPLGLALVMAYIYYVYTFRVCIDYILNILHRPIQAGLYLGIINTLSFMFFVSYIRCIYHGPGSPLKPPKRRSSPPVPSTTTPYQPQRIAKSLSTTAGREDDDHNSYAPLTDTTPLLRSSQETASSSHPNYDATSHHTYSLTAAAGASSLEQNKGRHFQLAGAFGGNDTGNRVFRIDIDNSIEHTSEQEHTEQPVATLSISQRDGSRRWCDICKIVKPDRCHHCSECDTCVLRMDHHCPWVRGCIGYNNHKFFFLFIFYASVVAVWVVATMIPLLVIAIGRCETSGPLDGSKGMEETPPRCVFDAHWAVVTGVAFLLTLLIVSFTAAHTVYIFKNRTTIESLQDVRTTFIRVQYTKPDPAPTSSPSLSPYWSGLGFNVVRVEPGEHLWDRGSWLANWKSIMGPSWWLWFLPYGNTPGDGIHDVYNDRVYQRIFVDANIRRAFAQAALQRSRSGSRADGMIPRPHANTPLAGQGSMPAIVGAGSSQSTLIPDRDLMGDHETPATLAVPSLGTHAWAVSRSSEESEASVGSMGRSLPTPRSSPQLGPVDS